MRSVLRIRELSVRRTAQSLFVVLAAWSLKRYYSAAGADDLVWILWPTAKFTSLVTGTRFYFEAHAGYMSDDRSFLIAAACSGVNFLITAFLLLSLMKLWRSGRVAWRYFCFAGLAAYASTVVANSVRISIAMWLNSARPEVFGLGREELHRLDGILIYFGFLLMLFAVAEPRSRTAGVTNTVPVKRGVFDRIFAAVKRYVFPLAVYYATTLGIPIANGAAGRGGEFWEHAVFVAATPIVMIISVELAAILFRFDRQRERVPAAAPPLPGDLPSDQPGSGFDVRDAASCTVPVRFEERSVVLDAEL